MARGLSYRQGKGNYHVKGFKNASNSGYLKSGPSYFPSHAPTWYSYTLDFAIGGHYHNMGMVKTARTVEKKLGGLRIAGAQEGWSNKKALTDIKALVAMARNSELAFLAKYNLGNPGNDWSELIKAFNNLFSNEQALRGQIDLIDRALTGNKKRWKKAGEKDKTYHDFTTYFSSNLQSTARNVLRKRLSLDSDLSNLSSLLDHIIKLALKKTFDTKIYIDKEGNIHTTDFSNKEKSEAIADGRVRRPFEELKKNISFFMNNQYFKDSIKSSLGFNEAFLQDTLDTLISNEGKSTRDLNYQKLPQLKETFYDGKLKGSIRENFEVIFGKIVAETLKGQINSNDFTLLWEAVHSGGSGVKADVLLNGVTLGEALVDISALQSQAGDDGSKRVNALRQYEEWFARMASAKGEIVFVSDKNYQINADFGGFMAQGKVTLKNLQALFDHIEAKVGMGFNVQALIDFLANCGNDMILGNRSAEVMDAIATQIGHFLFDDLTIEGSHSINRIHLLNLSGVYMPLSVYLEGILHAIEEPMIGGSMREYVSVNFTEAPGADAAASPWDSKDDWEHFRNAKLAHSYINVHFMKNFATFITSQVKF